MRHPGRVLGGLALVLAAAGALSAHDLFIKMKGYFVPPETPVEVPILNGTFQSTENEVTADRMQDVSLLTAEGRRTLGTEGWSARGDTTFLRIRTGAPGTYVVGVSTRPRMISLSAEDFNTYLEHDGLPDVLEQRRRDGELDRPARERYAKHVKAVFQVGEERTGGFDEALGYPAELVPLENPYARSAGDEFVFRALVDGEPVADQWVLAGGEAPDGTLIEERGARTNGVGVVRFVLDRPGIWYVKFIHMQKVPGEPDVDYESKWATLTFEVR